MSTIYNFAKQNNLIQSALPGGKWAGVASPLGDLSFMDGGTVNWSKALIDSGKAITGITLQSLSPEEVNAIISKLDMIYRAPEHQDIANMVAFLASDEASYVNGTLLLVDGGVTKTLLSLLPNFMNILATVQAPSPSTIPQGVAPKTQTW